MFLVWFITRHKHYGNVCIALCHLLYLNINIIKVDNRDKLTVKPHAQTTCASCNTPFTGKYCPDCGEKQLDRHDFAIQHYLEETLEGFTHFDNKFFRSVKILVTWPGMLTQYFSTGKRVSFLKPFQLFLICNLVFFLLAGKLNIFAQSLYSFYTYEPYTYFNTKPTILAKATTDADLKPSQQHLTSA